MLLAESPNAVKKRIVVSASSLQAYHSKLRLCVIRLAYKTHIDASSCVISGWSGSYGLREGGGGWKLDVGEEKFVAEMALLTNNPEWVSFGE